MKLVSIIIPIYNVAKFLRQCLDSIDLFDNDKIEILLINDGSSDESPDICNEFQERFNNVAVINKPNGGLSDARNAGIPYATGEWIFFLDSDDWLAPGAIMKLYHLAKNANCDIVQGGFYYAFSDHLLLDERYLKAQDEPFVLETDLAMQELICNNYIKNFAWGKLYRTSLVKNHPFPVGKYFEDSYWQHLIIHQSSSYGILPEPIYYYRQRKDSISGEFSLKDLDLLKGNENRLIFIKEKYPHLTEMMADKLWKTAFLFLNYANDHGDPNIFDSFKVYLSRISKEYIDDFSIKLKRSPSFIIYNKFPRLTPAWYLYHRLINRLISKPLTRISL